MNRRPTRTPLGIVLANVARDVSRAFDDALAAAGGSRPEWLVLIALKNTPTANQRELAAQVGIQGATLTHHLNAMEDNGLVTRRRDPENRRVHIVEFTEKGEQAFRRMVGVVTTFDQQLRSGFKDAEDIQLRDLLCRIRENVTSNAIGSFASVAHPTAMVAGEPTSVNTDDAVAKRVPSDG